MKKRILSLVLCAAMLLSMCLFLGAGVTNSLTVCDSDGEAVTRVDLPVNQKISLTAQAQSAAENDAYQWQIQADKNVWANILGSDTQTLELSYPLVASALSEKNTVQIRCRLTSAETGEATFSDAVTVEVTAATAVDTPASADAAAAPVLRSPAKAAAAANDADGTFTIIINYVFENGSQAAPSWTAKVAKGSDYSATITSPTVVGYAADQETVEIDVKGIQKDETFYVTYKPALVDFTVKYYQQNVGDDKYMLSGTVTKRGYTEAPVSKYATGTNGFDVNYDGFTRLLYDGTATIAADGSTVVELYYDRNYYLMNFNLDGGYGVEPIYARYGAPISVGTPTKPGYTFNGWNPKLPTNMPVVPKDAQPYKATWKAGSADYLVQYWLENANDANYSYDTFVSRSAAVGEVINGSGDKSYTGFHFDHADQNVTVNGDGTSVVNVYYKRNTYTLTFQVYEGGWFDGDWVTKAGFTNVKYGEDTTKYWKQAPSGYLWYTTKNGNTFYTAAPDMPNGNLTIYGGSSSGSSTIHYYEEGTTTSIKSDLTVQKTGWSFTEEDHIKIPGFTYSSESKNYSGTQYYLYYTRNSYQLDFNNHGKIVKSETISYEGALKPHYFVPDYPNGLESNAYQFAGWYTDPGCTNAVDWDTAKMPYNNTAFYAKWAPVTHTVKTWLTDAKTTAVNVGETGSNEQTVNHRELAMKPDTPSNGNYTFVGWFYKDDDGTEHAFDFSMPVTKNLDLYAKWSSNTLMKYTIHYKLKDGTSIADDTKGSVLAGSTKTFEAKTGDQLNEDYQSGYFPTTSSYSIIMDINGGNEYTFVYVPKKEVEYTVRYLDKATGEPVVVNGKPTPDTTATTGNAVVTETFKQITGYAPDAYQKRLVLSANEDENVLVFWYTKDDVHAPVQIVHEIQNIEGPGYTEYQSSTNLNGVIGEKYDETPLTIPGFRYNESASTASGKLTAAGLVLTLKYDRIEYPYEFRFLEQGTNKQLKKPVTETARYQAQVTHKAETIPGYTLVSAENQAINIAIENPDNVANKNVKTFYYTEQTVDIKYQVVGPTGSGTLNNYQETQLKVLTGKANGSMPTPNAGYKFVGWFEDEACTQQVKSSWVGADNKLTPKQSVKYDNQEGYGAATYYAKFERDVFDLTIEKKAANGSKIDQNQTFVFRVQGEGVNMQVVITGEAQQTIKNLPVGDYTITEDTNWSWKYTPVGNAEKRLTTSDIEKGAATVTFENKNNGTNWLTSLAKAINTWAGGNAHEKTN